MKDDPWRVRTLRGASALALAALIGAGCDERRTVTPKADGGFEDVPVVRLLVPEAGAGDAADAAVPTEAGPADALGSADGATDGAPGE